MSKLKSSLHLSHKWPQQCSVCRSGAFNFSRLFPCCDVRHYFHESSIRVMFYLLHLYLFSDTGVQRDLMWCRICQTFQSTSAFKWGSCWMIISFLYNVLWIVICPFVIFHFTFVLSVLWFTASDYPYGIIKLFSLKHCNDCFLWRSCINICNDRGMQSTFSLALRIFDGNYAYLHTFSLALRMLYGSYAYLYSV